MPETPLIALEILLGFGVPLVWGVWQLISLRREKARGLARSAEDVAQTDPESESAAPQ